MSSPNSPDEPSSVARETYEVIPWLVNGSLTGPEKDEIENKIELFPELDREQQFLTILRDNVKQQPHQKVPLEFSWRRLQRGMERNKKQLQHDKRVTPLWRLSTLAASFFIIMQSLFLWIPDEQPARFEPLSSNLNQKTLKVRFTAKSSQLEISQLLQDNHLNIVSGPSAEGFYQLEFSGEPEPIIAMLKKNALLVEYVQLD